MPWTPNRTYTTVDPCEDDHLATDQDGTVTFNPAQQSHHPDDDLNDDALLPETTDPLDITEA